MRQNEIAPQTPKQFIQTHHDLACVLFETFGTPPFEIVLDKPASHVGKHEISAMLDTISTGMADSPGLCAKAQLALVAIA